MTKDQIKLIHVAKGKAGLSEEQYRMMLRNLGNVDSCKDLTNETFEDCMAFLEDCGFPGDKWRNTVINRGSFANSRAVWFIRQLYIQYEAAREPHEPYYNFRGLVGRMSKDRTFDPSRLTPAEAYKLTEALKQMIQRLACGEIPGADGKHWPIVGGTTADLPF